MNWPVHLPPLSPARVHDYLAGGKDNFRIDREAAERMLTAHPEHLDLVQENIRFVSHTVENLAVRGTDQFLVLGCGLPRWDETPVHVLAQNAAPTATTIYLDHDLSCVVTTRAHYHHNPAVIVLDGDLRHPHHLMADPGLHSALDPNRPVAVVGDLTLQHLVDTEVTELARILATTLPAHSCLAFTHPSGDDAALAGTFYSAAARERDLPTDTYLARNVEHLESLLNGWTLTTAEISEHGLFTGIARLP